jgi:hypothetical protein
VITWSGLLITMVALLGFCFGGRRGFCLLTCPSGI